MRIKSYALAAISVFIWVSILSFRDSNKQFFNVTYVFKFYNYGISVKEIYRFITYSWVKYYLLTIYIW